jgi:hypothetical protein
MASEMKTLIVLGGGFALVAGLVAFNVLGEREPAGRTGTAPPPAAPSAAPVPESPVPDPVRAAPPADPVPPKPPDAPAPAAPSPQAAAGGWAECAVILPDVEGRIVLMARPAPDKPGTTLRQVRIETPAPGEVAVLPPCGAAARVHVYWYPREAGRGPFVRLQDPDGEYLLTMRGKSVARLLRIQGETHVGVFVDGEGGYGWTKGPDGKISATVSGKPAHGLQGRLADAPGRYLGWVEGDAAALRFVGVAAGAGEPPENNR